MKNLTVVKPEEDLCLGTFSPGKYRGYAMCKGDITNVCGISGGVKAVYESVARLVEAAELVVVFTVQQNREERYRVPGFGWAGCATCDVGWVVPQVQCKFMVSDGGKLEPLHWSKIIENHG